MRGVPDVANTIEWSYSLRNAKVCVGALNFSFGALRFCCVWTQQKRKKVFLRFCCVLRFHVGIGMFHRAISRLYLGDCIHGTSAVRESYYRSSSSCQQALTLQEFKMDASWGAGNRDAEGSPDYRFEVFCIRYKLHVPFWLRSHSLINIYWASTCCNATGDWLPSRSC